MRGSVNGVAVIEGIDGSNVGLTEAESYSISRTLQL